MKGYKALDQDMRAIHGNGMQFEMGKWYSVEGEVAPCKNGFHFCKSIENLDIYYDLAESRVFEVETEGDIKRKNTKYAARRIMLVRELTKQEINGYFKENWESLVKSDSYEVRIALAKQGYGLDVLIGDEDWEVRLAAAKQGYGLDMLIGDEDWRVRQAVAKQGYGLDILIHDKDYYVRRSVAEQGYGLHILIHDEDREVRQAAQKMLSGQQ